MKVLILKKIILKLVFSAIVLFFSVDFSVAQHTLALTESNFNQPSQIISSINASAQSSITAIQTQAINFGTYCVMGKAGGTISVGWDGIRSSTGNIILINTLPRAQPAIFEIRPSQGRYVSINFPATSTVTGSNGGLLIFDIGPTEKGINGSGFSANNNSNFIYSLRVGGTLHIPSSAIPGIYSGLFEIRFIQQ